MTILGTPLFMVIKQCLQLINNKKAPELLENKRYTNKTDIWAIGVVFY